MSTTTTATPTSIRWPAERFYFAVLDTSALPARERVTDEKLRYLLEPELPVALEEVHAVFQRLAPHRWLACAVPQRALDAEIPAAALSLTPTTIPAEFLIDTTAAGDLGASSPVQPSGVELLTGTREPVALRCLRRSVFAGAVASILLLAALATVGIERRIAAAERQLETLRARRATAVTEALGPAGVGQSLPPELRLTAELRAYRQTRQQDASLPAALDVSEPLAELLRRWPETLATSTRAIVVTDGTVHVHGTVSQSDAAQSLANATADLSGFAASFPSVQSGPEGVRFALEWRRAVTTNDAAATERAAESRR